jgi:uncharacterized membrane protein YqjE
MAVETIPGSAREIGLFDSLKSVARNAIGIVHTRLELLVTELAEEQARVVELALVAALSLLCLFLAVVFGAFLVVVAFWDTPYRTLATGLIAAGLLLAAIILWAVFVKKAKARGKFLAATLKELATDHERLQ